MTHVYFLVNVPLFLWKNFFLSINKWFLSTIEKLKTFFYYSNVHFFLGDVYQIYFTIFQEILIKYEVIFLAMLWCSAHLQYTFLSFQWWNLPTESVIRSWYMRFTHQTVLFHWTPTNIAIFKHLHEVDDLGWCEKCFVYWFFYCFIIILHISGCGGHRTKIIFLKNRWHFVTMIKMHTP